MVYVYNVAAPKGLHKIDVAQEAYHEHRRLKRAGVVTEWGSHSHEVEWVDD
jgi:hypothetical protein